MHKRARWLAAVLILCLLTMACGLPLMGKDAEERPEVPAAPPASGQHNAKTPMAEEPPPAASAVEPTAQPVDVGGKLIRQWASSAEASSEFGSADWSAEQATGPANTDACGDYGTAWASSSATGVEWLKVYFDTPVIATEINIYQSYNPTQVAEVYVIDPKGEEFLILVRDPQYLDVCPDLMTITVEGVDFPIVGLRLVVDQSVLGVGWNEIDAVELVGITVGASGETADTGGGSQPGAGGSSGGSTGAVSGNVLGIDPASLKPGSFVYELSGAENDRADGGKVQYQNTDNGAVIGLINKTERYSLSMFLPYDVKAGEVPLKPYDAKLAAKGPTFAIFAGVWFYYMTSGSLVLTEVEGGKLSGYFSFEAENKDKPGSFLTVSGVFNQIPIKP